MLCRNSTKYCLIPTDTKCELDISQAIKMPPMPGQSRSLLQFSPTTQIKREFPADNNVNVDSHGQENGESAIVAPSSAQQRGRSGGEAPVASAKSAGGAVPVKVKFDHDYFVYSNGVGAAVAAAAAAKKAAASKVSILPPPPPASMAIKEESMDLDSGGESYVEEDAPAQGYGPGKVGEERRVNVTTGQLGTTRTVVLHVPKDIK